MFRRGSIWSIAGAYVHGLPVFNRRSDKRRVPATSQQLVIYRPVADARSRY
jgi:hypothetical protein